MPQFALPIFLTVATAVIAAVVLFLGERASRELVRRLPGQPTAERQVSMGRLRRQAVWVLRIVVAVAAAVTISSIWGVDLRASLGKGPGGHLAAVALRIAVVFIVAVVAFEVTGFAIVHAMSRVADRATEPRRQAQLRTLGPLVRGLTQTTIIVVATLMALGILGIEIGPLLAGAGVVGIAVGFGAQTIVKDLLTGVFLLVEDIVSVGDIIRIGDSGGLVEQMTLRTIRLRDFDGTLHVFPYSEAQVVHNLTKSFSYYVFDLQISYSSDIDRALAIMRRVGQEMQADGNFGDKILEPIEVVGVDSLGESGVTLKARIKTYPIQQWTVGREYNRRIKLAFDAEGIEIPFPHMKVVLPENQLSELARGDGAARPN